MGRTAAERQRALRERLAASGGAARTYHLTGPALAALAAKSRAAGMSEQAYLCDLLTGPTPSPPSPPPNTIRAGLTAPVRFIQPTTPPSPTPQTKKPPQRWPD